MFRKRLPVNLLVGSLVTVFLVIGLGAWLPAQDCNGNFRPDVTDINSGESADCNENRTPDECETDPVEFGSDGEAIGFEGIIRAIASGELNGDDFSDLALSHGPGIAVLFGRQDGVLAVDARYEVADSVAGLVLTDLDGDGDTDLAAAAGAAVYVFENPGDGVFENPREFATPASASSLSAADVTGDGRVDFLTTRLRPGQAQFSVLVNQGDGTFAEPVSRDTGARSDNLAVGDLDADGDIDVVVPDQRTRTLQFFVNDGRGNFTTLEPLSVTAGPGRIHGGDLNGDGNLDLLVHFPQLARVRTLMNLGSGDFTKRNLAENSSGGVAVADLDADGDLDLVTSTQGAAVVSVHRNTGAGLFLSTDQAGAQANAVAAGDYDGDGDLDLALALGGDLRFLFRGHQGRVALTNQTFGSGTINPHGIAIADYDGDGDQDVAVPNGGGRNITVFHNDGTGRLAPGAGTSRFPGRLDSLSSGDVDNDGDIDMITASSSEGSVVLVRNRANGSFGLEGFRSGSATSMAAFGDMDGNGFVDLLGANLHGDSVTIIFNEDGNTFASSQTVFVGRTPWAVLAADLDGDGDNDLATANAGSFDVSVVVNEGIASEGLVNEGTVQFAPHVPYPAPGTLRFIVSGDFDHDGDIDLAAAATRGAATIFLNQGDATFGAATDYSLEGSPYSIATEDVDGDGNLDILSANEMSDTLSLILGLGDGTFSRPFVFAVGAGLRFAAAGDLDADGDIDLVSANRGSDDLTVLKNGRFETGQGESHRETICTFLDFHRFSVPGDGEPVERAMKFLIPARDDAALLPALFQHTGRFPQHREFLMTVFPERFPALDASGYMALVAQRATRDYFAGNVSRLAVDGQPVFGFDLVVDDSPSEALTLEEVRRMFEVLEGSFTLPGLAYFPRTAATRKIASEWEAGGPGTAGFPVILIEESRAPPGNEPPLEGTPTFSLEIPADLVICATFSTAVKGRGPTEEYELKSQLRLRGGVIPLPTVRDTFAAELFEEVRFGPAREVAEPISEGRFRVLGIPGEERSTVYRFNYDQDFVLADGRQLQVSWVRPISLRALGGERLDEKLVLTEEFFAVEVGEESIQASLDNVPLVRYGSCSYETLPRFDVRVQLTDGSALRFQERYLEADSLLATGPAIVFRAEVEIGGASQVVDDYYRLVYSAERHNTRVRYRVVLDPPLQVDADGIVEDVRAVEVLLADPPETQVQAAYLGSDFQVVRELEGTYEKTRLVPRKRLRFLRGDAGGDGRLDVTDPLALLHHLFRREPVACAKAADANDDGRVNVIDVIRMLSQLFGRLEALALPFPECGEDTTADPLGCEVRPPCAL